MRTRLVIALENLHQSVIEKAEHAVVAYSRANEVAGEISIVPVDRVAMKNGCSETEPLVQEAVRRAHAMRRQKRATIGIGISYGYVSTKTDDPRSRACFPALFAAAVDESGFLTARFTMDIAREKIFENLSAQMEVLHQRYWDEHEPNFELFNLGVFIATIVTSCNYALRSTVEPVTVH